MENKRQLNEDRQNILATFGSGSTLPPTGDVDAQSFAEKSPLLRAVGLEGGNERESCIGDATTTPKWLHSPQSIAAAPHMSTPPSELYNIGDRESPASPHDAESWITLTTTTGTAQKPEPAATQGELHGSESETRRQQHEEMDLQALNGAKATVSATSGTGGLLPPSCRNEDDTRTATYSESGGQTNVNVHMPPAADASPAARHRRKRLPCGLECLHSWKSMVWCVAAIVFAIACSLPLGFVLGRHSMHSNASFGGALEVLN